MAMLTAVTGIGRGTAEVFLLFMLDREDIWPAHDVALQEAARRLFGLAKRPDVKAMAAMAEAWRPHRGVAARLLWRYYGMTQRRVTTDEGAACRQPSTARGCRLPSPRRNHLSSRSTSVV